MQEVGKIFNEAKKNDPIKIALEKAIDYKFSSNEINNLKKQALNDVEEAFKFAETQPWPKPEDSLNDVYVNYPKNLIL